MKKLLVVAATSFLAAIAGEARAADLPIAVPHAAFAPPPFTWTSCYMGAHAGAGFTRPAMTDPVQLAQDTLSGGPVTTGVTTVNVSSSGVIVGGQLGCDYQFDSAWVVGIEGAASGSNMKGSRSVGLPAGFAGDTAVVTAKTDFIPSVTGRFGYAVDRWLFYVKGGAAWANDNYSVTGSFTGIPFDFEGITTRFGGTAGIGVEWAFSRSWSARLEYDYYLFGHDNNILMSDATNAVSGPVSVKENIQTVTAGLNFHIWGGR